MRGLTDRIIVVAGGATGIGAATARRLSEEGANVVVGDLNVASAEETAHAIEAAGGAAIALQYDQSDESSIEKLIAQSAQHFGTIHGIHANAADISDDLHVRRDRPLNEMTADAWEYTMSVNLIGYGLLIRSVLPILLANGGGSIVCTSSDGTARGGQIAPAYQAAKAGVNAMVRHVATGWGKEGVRCNAVSPGRILTESAGRLSDQLGFRELLNTRSGLPSPRLGTAEDVGNVVTFLLSDDASFVNGQVWSVNGGALLRE